MSRRRAPAPKTAFRSWTIQRATGTGIVAGLGALILAVVIQSWPEALLYPYVFLLAVTAFSGVSLLWITAEDMRTRGTSGRMRPIRGFDLAIGFALMIPALYGLWVVWPEIGS